MTIYRAIEILQRKKKGGSHPKTREHQVLLAAQGLRRKRGGGSYLRACAGGGAGR